MIDKSYEYDARKIFDFQKEDQYSETDDSWFAHHEPDPLVYTKATTEEEFKKRLPTTPSDAEREAYYHGLGVEYGRQEEAVAEQEVVPALETVRNEEEEQRVNSITIQKRNSTTTITTTKKEDSTKALPANIILNPSKATQPPRLKHQSVFERLRAHTTASAGKMSKQTTIKKKQSAQHIKKTLKKKLVLQERQQAKVATKKSQGTSKSSIHHQDTVKQPQGTAKRPIQQGTIKKPIKKSTLKRPIQQSTLKRPIQQDTSKQAIRKAFTPRTITTTTTSKKRVPHYMQTTTASKNKSRQL